MGIKLYTNNFYITKHQDIRQMKQMVEDEIHIASSISICKQLNHFPAVSPL